jgi:hypothetical protein
VRIPHNNGDSWVTDHRSFLYIKYFDKNILLKFIIYTHIKIKETCPALYGFSGVCENYI